MCSCKKVLGLDFDDEEAQQYINSCPVQVSKKYWHLNSLSQESIVLLIHWSIYLCAMLIYFLFSQHIIFLVYLIFLYHIIFLVYLIFLYVIFRNIYFQMSKNENNEPVYDVSFKKRQKQFTATEVATTIFKNILSKSIEKHI